MQQKYLGLLSTGNKFYIGDIATVEYYDGYYCFQTITGRLWFENKHMLFVSSNTCNAEIFAVNVISIKDADI